MPPSLSRLMPWTDRNGRFSALRAIVFLAVVAPAIQLLVRVATDDLGPRPLAEAIHVCGDWAARFLLVAVAITPLRHLSGRAKLIGVRRTIGLAALGYALVHVTLWGADLGFDLGRMGSELFLRPYLTIGFFAVAGLVALGVTSTDGAIRRLGAGWKRLHDLVHPILILALVHLFLQSKLDLFQGGVMTGVAFAGLAVRLAIDRRVTFGWGVVAAATFAALLFGAAGEALWFVLKTGRPVEPILAANFVFEARIAPAWWAAAITLGVGAVAVLLRRPATRSVRAG